ncbi:hypothetical protein H8S57_05740 [Lawsonibacter sp. NSJ-51]|uniref:Uncharacterized protein n=1 Tax=Lawsonibacter hominis TaxID=2763053 RepID=A0A8J6JEC7_9FIRM|nr:hypothetical protein [Lawsonibacter hominis]
MPESVLILSHFILYRVLRQDAIKIALFSSRFAAKTFAMPKRSKVERSDCGGGRRVQRIKSRRRCAEKDGFKNQKKMVAAATVFF